MLRFLKCRADTTAIEKQVVLQDILGIVMRSPEYAFTGGEYIRVIHLLTGYSTPQNANDTLYVGVY